MLLTNRKANSYQKKFSSKCAALSKAHKKFENAIENKTEKQADDKDVIHVTKVFPKGSSLANYIIYGLYSRKNLSQGKNYLYAKMSFNKIVTAVTEKCRSREQIFYRPFWGI